ncbi:MAG TPA: PilN domain-containing protein [Candidatus Limnocylindrales bacterium]|nr:PilN domain-containing protein [Candidatus Limnocylindrales bacterium]
MIRINLLGQERPKTTGPSIPLESSLRLVLFAAALILALVVLVVMYHQKSNELASVNAHIASLQAERARLQQTKAEVEHFEQQKTVLQQRIDVIEALQANRSGGQQLLQMVANTVGRSSSLWLTSLDRKGNTLNITGEAASIDAIANFITQMKRSGYFDKIDMQSAAENDIVKGAQTYGFKMTADVSQPKPAGGTTASAPARPGKS